MSQIVAEVLPGHPGGALSGPNLAREVAEGYPAACLVALPDEDDGPRGPTAPSHGATFRAYTGTDVVGCEIAGAAKNVIALATGHSRRPWFRREHQGGARSPAGWPSWAGSASPSGAHPSRSADWPGWGTSWPPAPARRSRNRSGGRSSWVEGETLDEVLYGHAHGGRRGAHRRTAGRTGSTGMDVEMPIAEQVAAIVAGRTTRDALAALIERPRPLGVGRRSPARAATMTPDDPAGTPGADPTAQDGTAADRRAKALAHVSGLLLEAGATQAEIDRAVEDGVLDVLAVDWLLVPSPRRFSAVDLAAETGQSLELLKRLLAGPGLPRRRRSPSLLPSSDLEAVRLFDAIIRLGATDVDVAMQMARVIGSSMARIAEAEVAPLGARGQGTTMTTS